MYSLIFYSSNSRENLQQNKHAFNHKLCDLHNFSGHNKNNIVVNANLKFTKIFNLLQSFDSRHLQTHRSLSFDTIISSLSVILWALSRSLFLSIVSLLSKLIYNLLLLFIGNLKIASTWIDWLTIKDCNNYLPNNLAS